MAPRSVVPLESNPVVFSELAHKLGLSKTYEFNDIYSISDPELLAYIPRPVKAIILLFPITEQFETAKNKADAQAPLYKIPNLSNDELVYWFPQQIKNACGLYALIHSIVNVNPSSDIEDGSALANLIKKISTSARDIESRTDLIAGLEDHYSDAAQQGQTAAPEAEEEINLHFISFVFNEKDGHLYELDGRRKGPIDLGQSSNVNHDVLDEPAVISKIQQYMDAADEKNKLNYNLMALTPSLD